MADVVPVHAQGFFTVSRRGEVYEILVFDYYDPDEYYARLIHRPLDYEREMARLAANMQEELDRERVIVNGRTVRPRVQVVGLEHRGSPDSPYLTFIIYFKAPLRRGLNVYENIYEESVAEYDYEVYWMFPPRARVVEVEMETEYEVLGRGNILLLWARRGDRVGGSEKIVFEL